MSRIAKIPIDLPKGVEVSIASGQISVKGPLGTSERAADPNVAVDTNGAQLQCKALGNSRHANAMSGTMRSLVANMVAGVTKGFEKRLALVGVGFRAQAQGDKLNLSLGFSHPVVQQMPKGINGHIYAQLTSAAGDKIIASASTLEKDVRSQLKNGGNRKAAEIVGQRIAVKGKEKGIEKVAFDRAGYKYHGRVKALAEAARASGLKF